MSDEKNEQNKPQDSIETTDELTDEELEQVAGGEVVVTKSTDLASTKLAQYSSDGSNLTSK
jgi:bacteriocin-like protein